MSIDVMTQALHYTRPGAIVPVTPETVKILVDALRLAIEQAERQEPVAWREFDGEGGYDYRTYDDNENFRDEYIKRNGEKYVGWVEPLYTAPPQRQPLTDRELDSIWLQRQLRGDILAQFRAAGRAVERKHGIGGGE